MIGSGHNSYTIIHMYNENALNIMIITCGAIQIDKKLLIWEDIFDYDKFEKAKVKSKVRLKTIFCW